MKNDYYPRRKGDADTWEENFNAEVGAIATAVGIAPADVTSVTDEVTRHRNDYSASQSAKAAAKSASTKETNQRNTMLDLLRPFVNRIKAAPEYTTDMGNTLRIIGTDSTFNPDTAKPILTVEMFGGDVKINFTHPREVDGVRIYSKRGTDTAFTFMATDTESPYIDNRANQAPGTAEQREYYAFYFDDDSQLGLQSDIVKISITK